MYTSKPLLKFMPMRGSPPPILFFEIIIFKMLAAGPGAHVLKGPAASILKIMISEVAHPFFDKAWVNT